MYISQEGHQKAFGGDFRGRFRRGAGTTASSLEADEPDPNRSNAFELIPAPLTPNRGNDFFPPRIQTWAAEAFSARLRPELPKLNFLLGFRALASANFWAEA
jgi:hypothetical protein